MHLAAREGCERRTIGHRQPYDAAIARPRAGMARQQADRKIAAGNEYARDQALRRLDRELVSTQGMRDGASADGSSRDAAGPWRPFLISGEQLFDRRSERPGESERDADARLHATALDRAHGLTCNAGGLGKYTLRETAGSPQRFDPRRVDLGHRQRPLPLVLGGSCPLAHAVAKYARTAAVRAAKRGAEMRGGRETQVKGEAGQIVRAVAKHRTSNAEAQCEPVLVERGAGVRAKAAR